MTFENNPPKRILMINIFGIGDVLFTTPVISNLKAQYPQLYIGYLCNRRTAAMLASNPKIDNVFIFERDAFAETSKRSKIAVYRMFMDFIKSIKNERFDTSLDVSLSDLTGFMTWRAGIRRRIGFQYKRRGMFLNSKCILNGYEDKHVVDYYLGLLEVLGVPIVKKDLELSVTQVDDEWAEAFLLKHHYRPRGNPMIGIVPGGGASWGKDAQYKRWPSEKYAKLADNLIEKFSADIILMGDQNEAKLCETVSRTMARQPILACGKTTIGQFAALARKCSLMIVNDGGPLHIAAAVGARTVSIFGPVDERIYGPYPKGNHIVIKKDIACRPCYRQFRRASCDHISCLNQLSVEEVFGKIKEIL
jgi:lipopolysaccharide heptosyltransferase II